MLLHLSVGEASLFGVSQAMGYGAEFWAPPHCQESWCHFRRIGWFAMLCLGDRHFWRHVLGGKFRRVLVAVFTAQREESLSAVPSQGDKILGRHLVWRAAASSIIPHAMWCAPSEGRHVQLCYLWSLVGSGPLLVGKRGP